jgi:hypothetical protein
VGTSVIGPKGMYGVGLIDYDGEPGDHEVELDACFTGTMTLSACHVSG